MRTILSWSKMSVALLALVIVANPLSRCRADDVKKDAPADAPKSVPTGKCFMWKATSPTTVVYMLGSIHAGADDMYPLPKEVEDGFANSKELVVEVDITNLDQAKMQGAIMKLGVYPGDKTLSNSIKKETYDALQAAMKDLNMPAAMMEKMKPWLVAATLEQFSMQKNGMDPKMGVDMHFLTKAKESNMKIGALETAEGQLETLGGMPDDLQEKFLASSVEETKKGAEGINKMKELWKNGDAKGLDDMLAKPLVEHPEFKPFMKQMIEDRNGPMSEKIDGFLKGNDPIFVVVGSAHLVGDKGIVKMLQDKNYKVEQVTIAPATPK